MNKHDKDIQDRLDAMPFIEARKAVSLGTLFTVGSPDHEVAVSWLAGKDAELRDAREKRILLWSIISALAAVVAAILAFVGLFH